MPVVLYCAGRTRSGRRQRRTKRTPSVPQTAPGLVCGAILALSLLHGRPAEVVSGEPRSSAAPPTAIQIAQAQVPSDAHVAAAADFQHTKLAALQSAEREAAGGAREVVAGGRHAKRTIYRVCRVTAYCDRGTTAAGTQSGVGQCAAPADIPLGSKVYIPELGRTFVVTDRTHQRFRRSTVDIFVPSKELCRRFGRNYLECEFTVPAPAVTPTPAPASDSNDVRLARK